MDNWVTQDIITIYYCAMKLYLVSQGENNDWDTYDSFVACAPDEDTARNMNPSTGEPVDWSIHKKFGYSSWCGSPESVSVELIGQACEGTDQGIICSSFNAG